MFSGIIERTGKVVSTTGIPAGVRLRIDVGPMAGECALGASVAVSGVCLTVCGSAGNELDFDVIPETLSKTTLGQKRSGDRVNIERSLRPSDRIDGHFVQGHVEGLAIVREIRRSNGEWVVWLAAELGWRSCVIPKGSIAIDGVSLTIAAVDGERFSVALIPTTLERTTLGSLRVSDKVNIETDILARTVVQLVSSRERSGLSMDVLEKAGFA